MCLLKDMQHAVLYDTADVYARVPLVVTDDEQRQARSLSRNGRIMIYMFYSD